jgi:hypothetical protein
VLALDRLVAIGVPGALVRGSAAGFGCALQQVGGALTALLVGPLLAVLLGSLGSGPAATVRRAAR